MQIGTKRTFKYLELLEIMHMKNSLKTFSVVFFPLPFNLLILPPPPCNHHILVHESFFLFAQSLHPYPPPSLAVSLLSMNESVPIFLVHFVHQIPHMSEIIYLSFSGLFSLSIMLPRSIHTVTKGKILFFMAGQYPTVNVPQWFYSLIY